MIVLCKFGEIALFSPKTCITSAYAASNPVNTSKVQAFKTIMST